MPIYAGNKKVSFNQSVLVQAFGGGPSPIVTNAEWGSISGDISSQSDLVEYVQTEIDKAVIDQDKLSVELSSFKKKQTQFETKLSVLDISTDWCVNRVNTVETEIPISVSQLINDVGYLSSVVLDPAQISTLVKLDGYSKIDHTHDISNLQDGGHILDNMLSVDQTGATESFKYIVLEDVALADVKYKLFMKNGNLEIQTI